jgi:hypothetical protein
LPPLEEPSGIFVYSPWDYGEFQAGSFYIDLLDKRLALFSRAWTFQERLISTRILHFTSCELVWECKTDVQCQCRCISYDHFPHRGKIPSEEAQTLKARYHDKLETGKKETDFLILWDILVCYYSRKSMTRYTDRLPAMSGRAREFETKGLGRYCAGLRLAGQVIDVNCQAAGLDATGAVSGASLILQTHVIDGLLMVVPPVDPEQAVDLYMFIVINTLNNSLYRFYPDSMAELDLLTVRHSVTCVLWAIDEPRGPLLGKGAACSYGFVLRRGRGEREIYQRLGLLEMWQYGPEAQERMQPLDFEQFFHGATVRTLEIV